MKEDIIVGFVIKVISQSVNIESDIQQTVNAIFWDLI